MREPVRLGLRENAGQFALLVLVNAFVGGVVGAQRSVLPLSGAEHFGLASATAMTMFVVTFGVTKALMNLVAGRLAGSIGRRHVLVAGWLAALPIPLLLALAAEHRAWWLVIAANFFLGINQGLAWTMTVVMKIDLVGGRRRGLALGLNEFAGYAAVAASAGVVTFAATAGAPLRGVVWMTGACAMAGLVVSSLLVRDTADHSQLAEPAPRAGDSPPPPRRPLVAACQAGLVNNLNDAVMWTTLPPLLATRGLSLETIGLFAALYPATWALFQLGTGWLSDRLNKTRMIAAGMGVQALGHLVLGLPVFDYYLGAITGCILLGVGTAMVYPTLLAFVADHAPIGRRSQALGVYRFWRDTGYVCGALAAGLIADTLGLISVMHASGALTAASGVAMLLLARRGR